MYAIELKQISKKYGENKIFNHFDLCVSSGEMVAIVGKSGTGKSTLLNMMGLLEEPNGGMVSIHGKEQVKINSKKATLLQRYEIGYLFQNFALVDNMSVSKNLDIALEYAKVGDKKEAKLQALEKVGLREKYNQKIYTLSGGEQQRVAVARLMLKPCSIILADEPTGSLDESNRDLIIGLLHDLHQSGKTVVAVTHDPVVANACQRTINL